MGFFSFFRRKTSGTRQRRRRRPGIRASLDSQSSRIQKVEADMQGISNTVASHSKELHEHRQLIDGQSARLAHLEDLVALAKPVPTIAIPRPTNQPVAPVQSPNLPISTNVNRFSEQERRILSIFFHNPGMALSYQDVGKALGKSPNTVKNQFHQITIKADLFDKAVDSESRNRFRLKNGLQVEQYLNLT